MSGVGISDNPADSLELGPSPEDEHEAQQHLLREVAIAINKATGTDGAQYYHTGGGIYVVLLTLDQNWRLMAGCEDGPWGFAIERWTEPGSDGGYNLTPQATSAETYDVNKVALMVIELVLWWGQGARVQTLPGWVRSVEPF